MFITRKTFEQYKDDMRAEKRSIRERFWKLEAAHDRLLKHLGLTECEIPKTTELRKKDGPERGSD